MSPFEARQYQASSLHGEQRARSDNHIHALAIYFVWLDFALVEEAAPNSGKARSL